MIAGKPSNSEVLCGCLRLLWLRGICTQARGTQNTDLWARPWGHHGTPKHTSPRGMALFASTSATLPSCAGCCPGCRLSLPRFPLCIPTLCKITQPYQPSSFSPIVFLPNPRFIPSQLFTMDEEQQDGKGKGFSYSLLFSHQEQKRTAVFPWDHWLFLIRFL